MIKQME